MKPFIISILIFIFLGGVVFSTAIIDKEITIRIFITLGFVLLIIVSDRIAKYLTK